MGQWTGYRCLHVPAVIETTERSGSDVWLIRLVLITLRVMANRSKTFPVSAYGRIALPRHHAERDEYTRNISAIQFTNLKA
jgi:hypothetical protein